MSLSSDAIQLLQKYTWPGNVRELQHSLEKAVILSEHSQLQAGDFLLELNSSDKLTQLEGLSLQEMEKQLIAQALETHEGNISAVAQELGITRPTLYNKLKKYQL